jgi:hypothetical protein
LNVESHRVCVVAVCGLQVAELDQLVADEIRVTLGYCEVTLSFDDLQVRTKLGRRGSDGIDDHTGCDRFSVFERDTIIRDLNDLRTGPDLSSISSGAFQQKFCRGELIHDTVVVYEETAGETRTKVRFEFV